MVNKIHSSHSKRELYEVIEVFELRIDNYKDMMKVKKSY